MIAFGYVLYYQILARENLQDLYHAFFARLSYRHLPWLIVAVLMMPVNWALETEKWRHLIRNFEPMPFLKAYKAIFSGVTLSIFTPNRIGEYGGRILYVSPENNWKAVIATLVGSFSQLLVLIGCGLPGLLYFSATFLKLESYVLYSIVGLGTALIFLMLFCFYNVEYIIPIARKIPWPRFMGAFVRQFAVLRSYRNHTLSIVLLYAFLRYLIYSLQYYFFLRFFGIVASWPIGMAAISSIYLLQTSIPMPPLMGLIVRGNIALYIWSFFSSNELAILAATFGLWILNLILPALVGMLLIINANVAKSLGYEIEGN